MPKAESKAGPVVPVHLWERLRKTVLALVLPVTLVCLWQLAGNDGAIAGGALPTPDRVWAAWMKWAFGTSTFGLNPYIGTWTQSLWFSAGRVVYGFAIAIAVGVPIGMIIGWSKLASSMIDPTIQWLRPVPITAWLPISIAIFGIRDFGAVFLITIGAFYPIVINTTQGTRDVDKNWIRAALMMGGWTARCLDPSGAACGFAVDFYRSADRSGYRLDRGDRIRDGGCQIRSGLRLVGCLLCREDGYRDSRYGFDRLDGVHVRSVDCFHRNLGAALASPAIF